MLKHLQHDSSRNKILGGFHKRTAFFMVFFLCFNFIQAHAQVGKEKKIGTVNGFYTSLNSKNARGSKVVSVSTTDGVLSTVVNVRKSENGSETIIGHVEGIQSATVSLTFTETSVEGFAVIPTKELAYQYTSDASGNVVVTTVDIHGVMCVDFEEEKTKQKAKTGDGVLAIPPPTSSVYKLQSLPGVVAVAYLDFDGEVVSGSRWAGGATINAQPMNLTETQINNIWKMISEDLSPFNINVTTDRAVYNAAPMNRRQMCIFTITTTAAPSAGGVAYLNSFSRNSNDSPCWVYNSGEKGAGETGSHELGHTFNLQHDGTTNGSAYYGGHGSWAPIMGNSMSRSITHWSSGEYANANMTQDDVAIIANSTNGFGYKTDDVGNTAANAKALSVASNGSVSAAQNSGIIHIRTDVDVYSFTTGGGNVSLNVSPAATHPNLDVLLRLTNASGTTITTANPTGLSASISTSLASGTYYLYVEGTGVGSPLNTGYSDYGSLGQYSISGTVPVGGGGNVPPTVSITSPANNASFNAPASITITANATDSDGSVSSVQFFNGSTLLGTDNTAPYSFSWTNVNAGTYSITARATDNQGAVTTSSVVTIQVTTPTVTCPVPTNLNATAITTNSALLTWSASANATAYVVWYRVLGTSTWTNPTVTGTSLALTGLIANTTYQWTINAVCPSGNSGYFAQPYPTFTTLSTTVNQPPTVSITSPANNASFNAPASFTITASASDVDGTIASVGFYNGATLIANDNTAPYSINWTNLPAGTYTLTARATDNAGAITTSAVVTVTVITVTGCTSPQYVENGGYGPGSIVKNGTTRYQCKPWPFSGWCNGAAWAYGPGTGMYWTDAWVALGACAEAQHTAASTDNTASISVSPQPFEDQTTVSLTNGEKITSVTVFDLNGREVSSMKNVQLNEVSVGKDLPQGIYILNIQTENSTLVTRLFKGQ